MIHKQRYTPPTYKGIRKLIDSWFVTPRKWEYRSIDKWEEYRKKQQEKYPIRWFIQYTIPTFLEEKLFWKIKYLFEDLYWWIQYRFNTKHQYHIIKPRTLKPGYHDPSEIILHTVFHLLSEFVEHEKKHQEIEWKDDKHHAIAWYEMNSLYDWWQDRPNRYYPELEIDVPEEWGSMWMFSEKYLNTLERKKWESLCKEYNDIEDLYEKEDKENLIRLIKIRQFLWYS